MGSIKNNLRNMWQNAGMIVVFLALFIICSFTVPYFLSIANLKGLALSVSMTGMVAATMLFCLALGDVDLSVESVVALSGVSAAVLINVTGNIYIGIFGGIIIGGFVGLLNGVIISFFNVNALITTLATLQIARGFGFIVSKGSAVGISDVSFFALGRGNNPIIITISAFIVFGILLNFTTYGKNTLAIGGNKEAARLAGINIELLKVAVFAVQGLMAGFAGVILASRITSGQPNTSVGFALDVISACVLGGVSLSGGIATISGVIVGVLIMGTVQNVMNLLDIPTFYQYVARGTILLLAVLFDQIKQRRLGGA